MKGFFVSEGAEKECGAKGFSGYLENEDGTSNAMKLFYEELMEDIRN